jgi:hypothetical protein
VASVAGGVDPQSNVFVTGPFNSDLNPEIDFDATHKGMGMGGYDMFLVKLAQ